MGTQPNESAFAAVGMDTTRGSAIDGDHFSVQPGLTKREYFAAMALQGLCSAGAFNPELDRQLKSLKEDIEVILAKSSVIMADELIKALNDGKQETT